MATASAEKSRGRGVGRSSRDDRSKLTFTTSTNFTPEFLLTRRSTENSELSVTVCGSVGLGKVESDSNADDALGRRLISSRGSRGLIAIVNCRVARSAEIQRPYPNT